jgi:hypothetical protein
LHRIHLQQNGLFLSFPYVCPKPVLVKSSFLHITPVINGFKRPFCYRAIRAGREPGQEMALLPRRHGPLLLLHLAQTLDETTCSEKYISALYISALGDLIE